MDRRENKRLPIFQREEGWSNRKKIWKISVATLLLLTYCAVFMQGFAYSAITEEEIDAFLAGQGVPKTAIQKLPFDLKKRIYLEKPRRNPTLKGATSKGGVEIFTKLGKRNCLYSYLIFKFCQSKIANVYLGMEILPGTYAYR